MQGLHDASKVIHTNTTQLLVYFLLQSDMKSFQSTQISGHRVPTYLITRFA